MYDVTTAKLFLLDMDGTFYLDDTLLPCALEFLALCRATGRQFAFLTNNSSKSKADYLAKLTRLGADVTEMCIRDRWWRATSARTQCFRPMKKRSSPITKSAIDVYKRQFRRSQ